MFGQCCFDAGDVNCTMGTGSFIDINTGSYPHASVAGKTETSVIVKALRKPCQPTDYRQVTNGLRTGSLRLGQNLQTTDGRQSTDRFFGELFFTTTETSADITLTLRSNTSYSTYRYSKIMILEIDIVFYRHKVLAHLPAFFTVLW